MSNTTEILARLRDAIHEHYDDFDAMARACLAVLEGELRDAERYRWLRTADDVPLLRGESDLLTGERLDDAIDAAAKERA